MNAILEMPRHRFSREQYEHMVETDIFGPNDRLELLDGEIIDMAPQKSRHATAIALLHQAFQNTFGLGYYIRTQLPLRLDDYSEPEPDIAVVTGNPRDYRDAHPDTAVLIVEVSESTLAYDRTRKLAAYARAGIPEYWILDLTAERLEVCRRPENSGYAERSFIGAEESIEPLSAGKSVAVRDLLP